jgi:hypothetical protein
LLHCLFFLSFDPICFFLKNTAFLKPCFHDKPGSSLGYSKLSSRRSQRFVFLFHHLDKFGSFLRLFGVTFRSYLRYLSFPAFAFGDFLTLV